jgi:hypothetical protein
VGDGFAERATPHELPHTGSGGYDVDSAASEAVQVAALADAAGPARDHLDALADRLDETVARARADSMRTNHDLDAVVVALVVAGKGS